LAIPPPPPAVAFDPARLLFVTLNIGCELYRVYDPQSKYRPGPITFRYNGPRLRFDHHRPGPNAAPIDDVDRGIFYAAFDLEGAVIEVFGDPPRVVTSGTYRVVRARLNAPLRLLELRGRGGMIAGPSAAISQTETRSLSQQWARYFYETPHTYGNIDGVIYANSHNYRDAVALFERAAAVIAATTRKVTKLASSALDSEMERIVAANNLLLEP
jgi:hypothetical protein